MGHIRQLSVPRPGCKCSSAHSQEPALYLPHGRELVIRNTGSSVSGFPSPAHRATRRAGRAFRQFSCLARLSLPTFVCEMQTPFPRDIGSVRPEPADPIGCRRVIVITRVNRGGHPACQLFCIFSRLLLLAVLSEARCWLFVRRRSVTFNQILQQNLLHIGTIRIVVQR